ncbi:MAG: MYXO-CTERM sorting domain-containing protein [Nannocystaceae bacterium]
MPRALSLLSTSIAAALLLSSAEARAEWTLWAEGLPNGVTPSIAISAQGEIFYALLAPQLDGNGAVYRASLDDPDRVFTKMPSFPLPTPQGNASYNNVYAIAANARGEPIVGLSINGNWVNQEPLLWTWDADAGSWIAATIVPAEGVCNRTIQKIALAPNGDVWASCQWHGAFRSTDDGRTFAAIDVSAAVAAAVPSYFPTEANGAGDLGALFNLAISPDGVVVIGSESGGVVMSTDDGATWEPVDQDPTDPMSPMARATNLGNVAGVGFLPDGRVIAEGGDGNGPYPPKGAVGLYIFDVVAGTTTQGTGFPDYVLGGLAVRQFVTLPSGVMFMHTGHDRVDEATGEPTFGGLARSDDGIAWVLDNDGIDEIFKVANMELWIDGLGRANQHPFASDGDDLYVTTKTGKIFVQSLGEGGGTTSGGETSTSDGGTSGDPSDTASATSDATASAGTSDGATTGDSATTGDGATTSDGATSSPAGGEGDEGCGCATRGAPGERGGLLLVGLAALGIRRRRSRPLERRATDRSHAR